MGCIMLYRCPSVCPKTPFLCDNSKSSTPINLKPGIYLSYRTPRNPIHFGVVTLIHRGHKGQIRFLEHNSKSFKAINMKPGTDTFLGAVKMSIYFGVTGANVGVTGVKFGVTGWQDAYSFWGQFWGHWMQKGLNSPDVRIIPRFAGLYFFYILLLWISWSALKWSDELVQISECREIEFHLW